MTIWENLFLNYVPAAVVAYLVLWWFGLTAPINRAIGSVVRRLRRGGSSTATANGDPKGGPSTRETNLSRQMSAPDIVALFAQRFLDADAQHRLSDPVATEYEYLFDIDAHAMGATPAQSDDEQAWLDYLRANLGNLSATDWGQLLMEEMIEHSDKAIWLDWKYNVLTMLREDDWDDQLGAIFTRYGLSPPTSDERAPILDLAAQEHGDRPEVLMMDHLQPLAEKRGYRLMIFDNGSDGVALFMVPLEQADQWHLVQLGNVLMIQAYASPVADPRNGGKDAVLIN